MRGWRVVCVDDTDRPVTTEQLLDIKSHYPHAKLVVGNTELSIEHRIKNAQYKMFVHVAYLPELLQHSEHDWGLRVGASVSISAFTELLRHNIQHQPPHTVAVRAP